MAKILVTGAGGLVGAAICTHLSEKGHNVIGIVRQNKQENEQTLNLDLSIPDLDLATYVQDIDGVVHTAAVVPNGKNNSNDEVNKKKTMRIDENIVNFCTKENLPVVYISSCGFYDLSTPEIKIEESPIQDTSPYHFAKITGEKFFLKTGNAIIARISSPYGPKLILNTVLKMFLHKALNNELITIWGTGNREQDFIHVEDIARFTELALFSRISGVFNVCQGTQTTMSGLAKTCIKICGAGAMELSGIDDPAENTFPRFSIQKAQNLLNWQPIVTLEMGLTNLIASWKND